MFDRIKTDKNKLQELINQTSLYCNSKSGYLKITVRRPSHVYFDIDSKSFIESKAEILDEFVSTIWGTLYIDDIRALLKFSADKARIDSIRVAYIQKYGNEIELDIDIDTEYDTEYFLQLLVKNDLMDIYRHFRYTPNTYGNK